MEENTVTTEKVDSSKRVRSSFTMDKAVFSVLKARSEKDAVSVSAVIEQAVSQFLGV
jgi:hypothetical protein